MRPEVTARPSLPICAVVHAYFCSRTVRVMSVLKIIGAGTLCCMA